MFKSQDKTLVLLDDAEMRRVVAFAEDGAMQRVLHPTDYTLGRVASVDFVHRTISLPLRGRKTFIVVWW
jgi:hypothetical protein